MDYFPKISSPPLIIIAGPTAAGKSDFATLLAQRINGVIINGDMAQMYEPLTIGTAKPAWRSEQIPHLLFDSISEPRDSSAREFRNKSKEAMYEVFRSGRIPIIVGGSLFYLSTLFFQLHDSPRNFHDHNNSHNPSSDDLWDQLYALDPRRAEQIHRHDVYRISRALDIGARQIPSQCSPHFYPLTKNTIMIHVTREREELYTRINKRVTLMLEQGWLDEIRLLSPLWRTWLLRKKIIGYDTLIEKYFPPTNYGETINPCILPEDVRFIQQRTRNYAKRQLTFWRSFSRRLKDEGLRTIVECDLTLQHIDLYLEKISVLLARKEN